MVLARVRQRSFQPQWRVLRGRPRYFLAYSLFFIVIALCMAACGVVLVVMTVHLWSSPQEKNDIGMPILFIDLLCGSIFVAALASAATFAKQTVGARQQMLVLLPEGFIVATAPTAAEPTHTIAYAQLAKISCQEWRAGDLFRDQRYALVCHSLQGDQTQWEMDNRFGERHAVARLIIEAHTRYHDDDAWLR